VYTGKIIISIVVFYFGLINNVFTQDSIYVFPSEQNICFELLTECKFEENVYDIEYRITSLECSKQPIGNTGIGT